MLLCDTPPDSPEINVRRNGNHPGFVGCVYRRTIETREIHFPEDTKTDDG
jgi:hypothetical protein